MKSILLLLFLLFVSGLDTRAAATSADLLEKGDALDKQLKTAEALTVFLEADRIQPNDAEILYRIAKQHGLSMSDFSGNEEKLEAGRRALEFSKRAVQAGPKNAKAHLSLAISYGRIAPFLDNKTKIAYSKMVKEEVDKALMLDPSDDLSYHVAGVWNYELANLNAVLRVLVRVVYGKLPAASNEEAARYFQKAIELSPNNVAHHIELGRVFLAMGQKVMAGASLNKGLRLPSREKDDEETKRRGRETLKRL